MKEKITYIDWQTKFGPFNDLQATTVNKDNLYVKLNALLNIMNIRPGTLQDTPDLGIDTDGIIFAEEGSEMDNAFKNMELELMGQSKTYIGDGFLQSIEIITGPAGIDGDSGAREVSFRMLLQEGFAAVLESELTKTGLQHKAVVIDDGVFGGTRFAMIQGNT